MQVLAFAKTVQEHFPVLALSSCELAKTLRDQNVGINRSEFLRTVVKLLINENTWKVIWLNFVIG